MLLMAQLTIRAGEDLVDRVRRTAAAQGRSMNEWANLVFRAATDPDAAGSDVERIRERLRAAGLLAEHALAPGRRPPAELIDAAGRRAARGRPAPRLAGDHADR